MALAALNDLTDRPVGIIVIARNNGRQLITDGLALHHVHSSVYLCVAVVEGDRPGLRLITLGASEREIGIHIQGLIQVHARGVRAAGGGFSHLDTFFGFLAGFCHPVAFSDFQAFCFQDLADCRTLFGVYDAFIVDYTVAIIVNTDRDFDVVRGFQFIGKDITGPIAADGFRQYIHRHEVYQHQQHEDPCYYALSGHLYCASLY